MSYMDKQKADESLLTSPDSMLAPAASAWIEANIACNKPLMFCWFFYRVTFMVMFLVFAQQTSHVF